MPATIVMAGHRTNFSKRIFVVSRDTWERRKGHLDFGPVGLIIFDEAHIGISAQKRIVEHLEPDVVLGYTATPVSTSGPGMGAMYEELVQGPSYGDLILEGHLVPTRYVAARLDTSGLRVGSDGDYMTKEVVELVRGQVLADLYDAYGQYARERTVIFAPSVEIAWTIAARFGEMGVRAAVLDWATKPPVRREILSEFREGRIKVIVNVDVLSEGWDEPRVDTIILASPTRSLARYLQRVGRGMRPSPGKSDVLVIDLVGSVYEHGTPEDIEGWELEEERPNRKVNRPGHTLVKRKGLCPMCRAEMKDNRCKVCGFEAAYIPKPRELEVVGGKLEALWDSPLFHTEEVRQSFYRQLLGVARMYGKKDGWAAHAYKERYGEWPLWEWKELGPLMPSDDALRWTRYLFIRFAKKRPVWGSMFKRKWG